MTSGGSEEIELDTFDHFVLVGLNVRIQQLVSLANRYSAESHRAPVGRRQLVSDSLFEEIALGFRRDTLAFNLAAQLLGETKAFVTIVPQPFPSASILSSNDPRHGVWSDLVREGDQPALSAAWQSLNRRSSVGRLAVLDQSENSIDDHVFTHPDFSRGAEHLRSRAQICIRRTSDT